MSSIQAEGGTVYAEDNKKETYNVDERSVCNALGETLAYVI